MDARGLGAFEGKKLDSIAKFKELSRDDYFSKNNTFSTCVKEEKGVYFSDLSFEAAHDLLSRFVKDSNSQKLYRTYNEGIDTARPLIIGKLGMRRRVLFFSLSEALNMYHATS